LSFTYPGKETHMPEAKAKSINPLVAIAAVSVIIFSAVGVGVMTGVIPSSKSEQSSMASAPQPAAAPAPAPQAAAAPAPEAAREEAPKKVVKKEPKHEATHVASAEPPQMVQNEPAPPPPPAPRICSNCGSVVSVNAVKQKGEGSGLGAVGGAVVGGLLGNQIGRGTGRTVATVVGAGAGALAGNEVEKRSKSTETYHVAVRMDDGSTRDFSYNEAPSFRSGDKVKVVEGRLVLQ
jgi:outer membrane lipoprotein SlyB